MRLYQPSLFSASISLLFSCVGATLVNFTIDDKFGDPTTGRSVSYFPADAWNDGTRCNGCTAHPDESMLYKNSWTDSTFNALPGSNNYPNTVLSASALFNGTAVYVLCALARTTAAPTGDSDMSFYIDGRLAGTFAKSAPGVPGYDYNVTVFSETGIPAGEHNLTILNGHVNGTKSLILLDSIVYTNDDGKSENASSTAIPGAPSSENSSGSNSKTTIIAAVVASVGGVILLVIAFLLYRKHQQSRRSGVSNVLASELSPPGTPNWNQMSHTPGPPSTITQPYLAIPVDHASTDDIPSRPSQSFMSQTPTTSRFPSTYGMQSFAAPSEAGTASYSATTSSSPPRLRNRHMPGSSTDTGVDSAQPLNHGNDEPPAYDYAEADIISQPLQNAKARYIAQ